MKKVDRGGFSVEVRFVREGASSSSDDDVGGIVTRFHTLIQSLFLDQP